MSAAGFLTKEEEAKLSESSNGFGGDGSGFDDGFSYDTEGLDSDQVEKSGWLDKDGNYHFEIADIKFDRSRLQATPYIEFTLIVLHSVPGQSPEGSRFTSTHYITDGTRPMVTLFGHRIGALKAIPSGETNEKGQPKFVYVDARTGSKVINQATWLATKGSQFVGVVRLGKDSERDGRVYKGRHELVGTKCWPVDSEEAADVPKNLQAMKLIGKKPFEKAKTPAVATAPATSAAKTAAAAKESVASKVDDLSDL